MELLHILSHGADGGGPLWELPPLHPVLVNFTAALIPVSVLSDWLGWWLKRDALQTVGRWTMLYAALVTPLTAGAGWLWLIQGDHPASWQMPWHQWLGTALAAVVAALGVWRWRAGRPGRQPGLPYLLTATLATGVLVVQGDLGGQMSFGGGFLAGGEDDHVEMEQPQGRPPDHHQADGPMKDRPPERPADDDSGGTGKPAGHEHDAGSGSEGEPTREGGEDPGQQGIEWRDHIKLED